MKTVFQRGLSLIMCLLLICSTMSVMTFGASAADDFDYKTYVQNATKENIHHILDFVDETLKEQNIKVEVDQLNLVVDLTSIDAICATLDDFRLVIKIGSLLLGDLKKLELDVFDKNMSRSKSGDAKIFSELLELADANSGLVEKFISGDLSLGLIGDTLTKNLGFNLSDIKISQTLREGIVDGIFSKDDPRYAAAKNRALTDFDAFVYTDIMGLLSAEGGILEGVVINEDTTIDDLITNVFDIIIDKYVVDLISGLSFKFADIDAKYAKLDTVLELDGDYDFTGISFTKDKSVLAQINNVLGKAFAQVVPDYTGWTEGDHKLIGDNVRRIVKYVAEESEVIKTEGKSDEQLMLEIFKLIAEGSDPQGAYLAVKDTKNLTEMLNKLLIHVSGKSYPAGATYEHVLGDYVIDMFDDFIPLIDESGKTIIADGKKTVWEVFNSVFNFYFVEKNLDAFFGWNFTKKQTYFEKLDIMLDYTADDGTADFSSKTYFDDLLDSIFSVDLQSFVDLTAAKALGKGRNEISVVTFLYNTAYNAFNNWTESSVSLKKYDSKPFNNAISDDGLANIVRVVLETLDKRSESTSTLVGLLAHHITSVAEKAEIKDSTCTAIGYSTLHKTCLKCNKVYLKGATIAAKGHKYDSGKITKKPTCTAKGVKTYTCTVCKATKTAEVAATGHKYDSGKITKKPTCTAKGVKTYTCTVCKTKKTSSVAATGHKASAWKTTKKATYTATGTKVKTCTVCKATVDKATISRLTLSKPSGLKASAVSTTSIKFSWKKVTGAVSYVLYYKTGSGKWKTVKTSKTSATVKKLKAGTTYKFKVVALADSKGKYKSKDSSTVSGSTKPATVSLKSLRSSKKKEVVVEWKKLSGVTGYEVQYSTSSKFKKPKTVKIKKSSTYKTIIKKLSSKKKYYVRVRAYKTIGKTPVYGAYSKTKSIKCK